MRVGRVRNAMLLPLPQWIKKSVSLSPLQVQVIPFLRVWFYFFSGGGGYSGRQVLEGPVSQVQMVQQQLLNLCPLWTYVIAI